MNTIIIDKEYYHLKDQELNLVVKKKNLTIDIEGKVIINDFKSIEDSNIVINIKDNSQLIFNRFSKDISLLNTEINVNNNSVIRYHQSIYTALESSVTLNVNIKGDNNNILLHLYGVSTLNGSLKMKAQGNVIKHIKNNELLEDVRILSLNDNENIIYPDLLVASDLVNVNHNATISGLNEENLFYLTSKGLSKEEASILLVKGFLLGKLELNNEDKENLL